MTPDFILYADGGVVRFLTLNDRLFNKLDSIYVILYKNALNVQKYG